jgi:PadR family transcriptional regulator, regulatory protein PadR
MYEICQSFRAMTKQQLIIREGSLYPALYKLKEEGLLKVESVKKGQTRPSILSLATQRNAAAKGQVTEF